MNFESVTPQTKLSQEDRKAYAEHHVRHIEGFMWLTIAPPICPEGVDCDCAHFEQYLGETREEAIEKAMTEVK